LFIQGRLTFLFQKPGQVSQNKKKRVRSTRKSFIQQIQKNISVELVLVMIAVTVFNCTIVLTVQFSYVFALTYGLNHFTTVVVAMSVAAFHVFWNRFIVINIFSNIVQYSQSKLKHQLKQLPPVSSETNGEQGGEGGPSLDNNNTNSQSSSDFVVSSSVIANPLQQSTENLYQQQQQPQEPMKENYPSPMDQLTNEVFSVSSLREINSEHNLFNEERRIYFLTHLLLFNNVLAPLVASAFVSADCFYYVVVTPPEVQTSYSVFLCAEYLDSLLVEGNCFSYATFVQNISYLPPFFYSYQCSSALLTSFAAVYLLKYLYIGVLMPLLRLGMKSLQEWFYWKHPQLIKGRLFAAICWCLYVPLRVITPIEIKKEREQHKRSELRKRTTTIVVSNEGMKARIMEMVPVSFRDRSKKLNNSHIDSEQTDIENRSIKDTNDQTAKEQNNEKEEHGEEALSVSLTEKEQNNEKEEHGEEALSVSLTENERDQQKKLLIMNNHFLFQAKRIVNRGSVVLPIISEFTVFITFGAIFPPLAIVVCYTIFITTYFIQLMIGRFLCIAKLQKELGIYITKANEECCNFRRLFLQSIPSISILASFFWGFFLFDILGDEVSSISMSLWILFGMGVSPILIYFGEKMVFYYLPEKETDDEEQKELDGDEENGIELEEKKEEIVGDEEKQVDDFNIGNSCNTVV
jgi:hypothetical protein